MRTGRELDVAIVGHGFFSVVDVNTAEVRYTRSGELRIDANGQLATTLGQNTWAIDPPIHLPSDWERVAIQHEGTVQCLAAGTWHAVGQFQLARFVTTPTFGNVLAANAATDVSGPPHIGNPLDDHGVIQQG